MVINIEQQLHGYRHGHELLSTSVRLSPQDQDLVDRLSDVAGPLGPDERFAPYLTCYPLPSGSHYAFARTWQDLAAPRAGCVRTRTLLIPMQDWITLASPATLAGLTNEAGPIRPAQTSQIFDTPCAQIPPVDGPGTELLEALFLEERMPVAVFGADKPEVIALRLLTATWPAYRRRFSLSTFCNSPRSIAKKSFDLVFAPIEARSRFSDWKGRRVDGGRRAPARHRWSESIVENVFRKATPSLIGLDVLGAMAEDERGSEDALRVSLLWEDLHRKVANEPHAALGLLDIANTRAARNDELIAGIEPALALATANAVSTMASPEAWRFLLTLYNKLGGVKGRKALADTLRSSLISLTRDDPEEATKILQLMLSEKSADFLIGAVGNGLALVPIGEAVALLRELKAGELLQLLISSPSLSLVIFKQSTGLDPVIAGDLGACDLQTKTIARERLITYVVNDDYVKTFGMLLDGMTAGELVSRTSSLHQSNGLRAEGLNLVIVDYAVTIGAQEPIRDLLVTFPEAPTTNFMLERLLRPISSDVAWVINDVRLDESRRQSLLLTLIDRASNEQIKQMLSDTDLFTSGLRMLESEDHASVMALAKVADAVPMETQTFLRIVLRLLPDIDGQIKSTLAIRAFEISLGTSMEAFSANAMAELAAAAGARLNSDRAIRYGLDRNIPPQYVSRNLVFFCNDASGGRARLVRNPDLLAGAIVERGRVDFSYDAAQSAADVLWEGAQAKRKQVDRAYAHLLAFLLPERGKAASALVAAAFPIVYEELKHSDSSDLLSLMFPFINWKSSFEFLEWTPSKSARVELSEAFERSDWLATDVALAAARAGDATRILKQIFGRKNGHRALWAIKDEINNIPSPWRQDVQAALKIILEPLDP